MGHVLACQFALAGWGLGRIIVVPSYQHPFGKPLEAFEHRAEMIRQAVKHLGEHVVVSYVEQSLGGVSYTIETLRRLQQDYPGTPLRLIVGSDILEESAKWYKFEEIRRLAPLLVIPRQVEGQASSPEHLLPDVSSSRIRAQLAAGQDPGLALPVAVMRYVRENALYGMKTIM